MTIINEKRRYAQVRVADQWFDLDKKDPVLYEVNLSGYTDIYEAYARPSTKKIAVWHMWNTWFRKNGGYCVICSKNCSFFSIEGYFTDHTTGKRYYAYITYANHKLYEVMG